jgi:AAA domain
MPATLLERLLPGGCILDVPAVPDAVWGEGEDQLWAVGQALIIAGPDGVGKTTLAGNLVQARLGSGPGSVLGMAVKPGARKVLYLAMDRPKQAEASLARLFTAADLDLLNTRLVIWEGPPPQDLAKDTSMLARLCALADADTCVIDSLKDAAVKLSEDEAGAGWNRARQTAIQAGAQLLELHHPRKGQDGNRKPRTIDDLYGSRWIPAGAGSIISLWGQAGDPVVELTHLKPVVSVVAPIQMAIDGPRGIVTTGETVDLVEQVRLRSQHGMTAKVAARLMFGTQEPDASEIKKADYQLRKKARAGVLYQRPGTRGGGPDRTETTWFMASAQSEKQSDDPHVKPAA